MVPSHLVLTVHDLASPQPQRRDGNIAVLGHPAALISCHTPVLAREDPSIRDQRSETTSTAGDHDSCLRNVLSILILPMNAPGQWRTIKFYLTWKIMPAEAQ